MCDLKATYVWLKYLLQTAVLSYFFDFFENSGEFSS